MVASVSAAVVDGYFAVIGALLLVIWVVLIVSVLRNARRGEAFLRDHPDLSGR
ncbi:hypothetical protein [Micromonospora ureilytica]|uniref:hypothetical protein n=1 Tax=Micromonospora ureilytica TaxID=709868 RepID=UPI00197BC814|nr:hypothetical protein [Micromonospora ureilytica]